MLTQCSQSISGGCKYILINIEALIKYKINCNLVIKHNFEVLKDFLSFKEVDLEFKKGLVVFTGPSGAGKSILMDAFLSLFGYKDAKAALGETIISSAGVVNEAFDINENDDIIIKEIKKEKVRYFINNQSISKKNLFAFSHNIVKHLHLRDVSDFQSVKLITFLVKLCVLKSKKFSKLKEDFESTFLKF